MIIDKGSKVCGLYILIGTTIIDNVLLSCQYFHDNFKLWHLRLEHVSERDLFELVKQSLLVSEKLIKLDFCDSCIFSKQH